MLRFRRDIRPVSDEPLGHQPAPQQDAVDGRRERLDVALKFVIPVPHHGVHRHIGVCDQPIDRHLDLQLQFSQGRPTSVPQEQTVARAVGSKPSLSAGAASSSASTPVAPAYMGLSELIRGGRSTLQYRTAMICISQCFLESTVF